MQIPYPHDMDLKDWADGTTYALGNYTSVISLQGDDWQDWGMFFFNNPQLVILGPPNPYDFKHWREWAERLADALNNASGFNSGPKPTPPPASFIITQAGDFITTQSGQLFVTQ